MQLSEKEKMIKGDMYNANDIYLVIERDFAKEIIFKINSLPPIQKKDRKDLFKILIKTKGDFEIEPPFYCDYGYNIEIGENFYANYDLTILDGCKVKISDNVMIGPKVGIYTATHPTDAKMRILGLEYGKEIVIEDNVWIGGSVTIIAGVRIGKNSVIGAGSVVVNDIPENSIAVGNPCKVIKKIPD